MKNVQKIYFLSAMKFTIPWWTIIQHGYDISQQIPVPTSAPVPNRPEPLPLPVPTSIRGNATSPHPSVASVGGSGMPLFSHL